MKINHTLHSTDTCKCKRLFKWDSDDPLRIETPVESFTNARGEKFNTFRCPEHQIANLQEHFDTLLVENQTKNKAIQAVAESDAKLAKLTDDGKITPNLDKLSYSFDKDRKLTIISKDKSVDMTKIQADLDTKFGTGKVKLA